MKLSNRLETILSLLDKDLILSDIGCDHGFLSIEYAKNNNCKVYAIDNKQGPLESCKNNIKKVGLEEKVIPILSNGLKKCYEDTQQLVIAGMGGNNIIDIIDEGFKENKLNNLIKMVLQPNNNQEHLRTYLMNNGFSICDEKILRDGNYIYEILIYVKNSQKLDDYELKFGPVLLKNKNDLFINKWSERKEFLTKLLLQIKDSKRNKKNIEKINDELKMINEVI